MTHDRAAFLAFNAAVARAKRDYYRDGTQEQLDMKRAKAVRKAEAQQRYRDRIKKERP